MATAPNDPVLEMIDNATRTMPWDGNVSVPAVRLLLACLRREAANDSYGVVEVVNGNRS